MEKMNYEKPKMKKVFLYGKERIADAACWSTAANSGHDTWYYDYNKGETGYLIFHTYGNCGGWDNIIQIVPENAEGGKEAADKLRDFLNLNGSEGGKKLFTEIGITDDETKVS